MALALAEAKRLYGGGWGTLTTEEQAAILRGDGPLAAADDDDDDNDGDVVYVPTVWCDGIPPRGGGRATPVAARGAAPEEIGGVNFEGAEGAKTGGGAPADSLSRWLCAMSGGSA